MPGVHQKIDKYNPIIQIILFTLHIRIGSDCQRNMTFGTPYVNTKHASAKIVCLCFGGIVSFCSLFSFLDSPWFSENLAHFCSVGHKHKELLKWNATLISMSFTMETTYCPNLIMERFFVYSSIAVFFVTFIIFVCCCYADIYTVNECRNRDAAFHVAAAMILIAGGVLQVASAQKVENNRCWIAEHGKTGENKDSCGFYFHHNSKYIAAGFGFAEAIVYIVTACIVENTKLLGLDGPRLTLDPGGSRVELPYLPLTSHRRSTLSNASTHRRSSPVGQGQPLIQKRTSKLNTERNI